MHKTAKLLGITTRRYYELTSIAETLLKRNTSLAHALIKLEEETQYSVIEKLYIASAMGSREMLNITIEG